MITSTSAVDDDIFYCCENRDNAGDVDHKSVVDKERPLQQMATGRFHWGTNEIFWNCTLLLGRWRLMMMMMMVFDYNDDYISDGFGKYGDSSGDFCWQCYLNILELNSLKPKEEGKENSHYICDDGGDYDGEVGGDDDGNGGSDDDNDEDDSGDVGGDRSQLFDRDKFDGTWIKRCQQCTIGANLWGEPNQQKYDFDDDHDYRDDTEVK